MNPGTINVIRRTFGALPALAALAAVLVLAARPALSAPPSARPPLAATAGEDSLRAHADMSRIAGDSAAPLWLILASDFQCPYCAQWHRESFAAVQEEYVRTGRIRLAYLNLPLEHHPHARIAAAAALCAGTQDRFWEMHDAIFDTQERWSPLTDASAVFDSLAARVVPESDVWKSCVNSGVMNAVVAADRERILSIGVQSTPTLLISYAGAGGRPGQLIRGAVPLPELRQVLDSMLTAR